MAGVRPRARLAALAVCLLANAAVQAGQTGVIYLAVDLESGRTIAASRADLLDTPAEPGSVAKIATLAAALESGVVTERTAILCTRKVVVAGRTLTCSHPDLHRPLRAAEALAHSCNVYFATIAGRLARTSLDAAFGALGLMPSHPGRPVAGAALGIDGVRASPRQLVAMMARVGAEPGALPWKPDTLRVLRDGLRGAAEYGTASELGTRHVSALAKTGTTITAGGARGLVVGVTPSSKPAIGFVLVAAGAAGADAAALAAERLRPPARQPGRSVRIGTARAGGGYTVRTVPIEEYVADVVAGEGAQAGPAALEALAIAARTFTLANRGRHADDGFDLCDLTHCQVPRPSTAATRRAAAVTAGKVLLDRGTPADVFYSASCGGHTAMPSAVWPGARDRTFLPARADDAHGDEPVWTVDLPASDLARALRAGGFSGDTLRDLATASRDTSGRVAWLRVDGVVPDRISGADLRTLVGRTLGWQHLKSTLFDVRRIGSGYRFTGRGAGHGVGLCVLGSTRLAAKGQSAEGILARYFPGLRIGPALEPTATPASGAATLRIVLPEADESERDVVRALVRRTRDELGTALGVDLPDAITLRFHTTVEAYQRATRQPWFTAGATAGTESQFIPLSILRRRGLLERTVRHELVHLLTSGALEGRPRWLVEGLAAHYADGRQAGRPVGQAGPGAELASAPCPSDREFTRPTSADTLRGAYERARACVARRLAAGGTWDSLR